jgi:hypothetical protein
MVIFKILRKNQNFFSVKNPIFGKKGEYLLAKNGSRIFIFFLVYFTISDQILAEVHLENT